jgi:hypothetical protein
LSTRLSLLLVPLAATIVLASTAAPASAGSACTKSLRKGDVKAFVASLSAGETGCIHGSYNVGTWQIENPRITLRGDATFHGVIYLEAPRVTLKGFTLNGANIQDATLVIYANRATIRRMNITNDASGWECILIGSRELPTVLGARILRSRLHDCGPPGVQHHGIYVDRSDGAVIKNNVIKRIPYWGLQLYPYATNTLVAHNRIQNVGRSSVLFGSQYENGTSSGNVVRYNILAYPALWYSQTYWGGLVGSGNVLARNCVWGAAGGVSDGGSGVSVRHNVIARPKRCPDLMGPL